MKAKLLKQLRQQAREFFWIEKWPWRKDDPYVIRSAENCEGCWSCYANPKTAAFYLQKHRREFILDHAREQGKKSKKYKLDL